jgi:glutathione S-transferase
MPVLHRWPPCELGDAAALEAPIATPYLTGETLSLADLRLRPHFDWLRLTPKGEAILAGKSKLTQWFRRVSERPSAKEVRQSSSPS